MSLSPHRTNTTAQISFVICALGMACSLFAQFVFPALPSLGVPWTCPVALFSYPLSGTSYFTTRRGYNLNTASGMVAAVAFLIFVSTSLRGAHAHSLDAVSAPANVPTPAALVSPSVDHRGHFSLFCAVVSFYFYLHLQADDDPVVLEPPRPGIRKLATLLPMAFGPRRRIKFADPLEISQQCSAPTAPPPCCKNVSVDTGQLVTFTSSRNLIAAAGLWAMFLIYLVGSTHTTAAGIHINLLAQEVLETRSPSLPRPELPPFPGNFAQGVIEKFRDKHPAGIAMAISVIFLALGFLDLTEWFGCDVASILGFKKIPSLPIWFLVFMAVFGACLLGLCYL